MTSLQSSNSLREQTKTRNSVYTYVHKLKKLESMGAGHTQLMGQQGEEERIQHEPWTPTTAALDLLVILLYWNWKAPSVEGSGQHAP